MNWFHGKVSLVQDTRIARGDGGSVFVMVKEVSLSSATAFEAADLGTTADIAFGATPVRCIIDPIHGVV